ncbi:DUF6569 family protein [Thermodesulfovibrio sp.]|uniref:ARPP-1 family domain-containing protein n=1 Tax=Thermodesulfovibrio sp. TaxID=2067987 RepID=UPI0030A8EC62
MEQESLKESISLLNSFINSIHFSDPQAYRDLIIFPLYSDMVKDNGYMLLDEALQTEKFRIQEISDGGSVPELTVTNELDSDVLLLEGDILVGAKQNRTVNTTIIVGKGSKLVIPVSCVEQGRWRYKTRGFRSSKFTVDPDIRKMKAKTVSQSLRHSRQFRADQGGVWNTISEKMRRHNYYSESMDVDELYESRQDSFQDYERSFSYKDQQIGIAVFNGNELSGCDIFGVKGIMYKTFKKIISGYIFEGIEKSYWLRGKRESLDFALLKGKLDNFLKSLHSLSKEVFKSVGEGNDIRFDSPEITGYAIEHNSKIVHIAGFYYPEAEQGPYFRNRRWRGEEP